MRQIASKPTVLTGTLALIGLIGATALLPVQAAPPPSAFGVWDRYSSFNSKDYDAGAPTMKTALSVTGKGDNQWHHEVVTLNDAVFRHGGTKGSDLALINTDDKDDIFSLIEVHRGKLETPVLLPADMSQVSKTATSPTNAEKAGKPAKGKKAADEDEDQA